MWQNIKNIYHLFQGILANIVYGFPSRKIKVIGITGTDGKTTTTSLIYHILKSAGKKVSVISSVYAQIGSKMYDTGFHVTTPSRFTIQKFLKQAVDNGDDYFILETTSHALDQHRVYGVKFAIGVITNITHEHLQYHKTYENYVRAKMRLIEMSQVGIINREDESCKHIVSLLHGSIAITPQSPPLKGGEVKGRFNNETVKPWNNRKILTYGLKNDADFNFDISTKLGTNLAEFNKYNYLAAYVVCKQLGLEDEKIYAAMKTFKLPPGRMDKVYDKEFVIFNDFAHTPNGIYHALKAIKNEYKGRHLIHVFSAASERDDAKRPFMGEASGEFADLVILTEEDYRREDPLKINKEIAVGLEKKRFTFIVPEKFGNTLKTYTILTDRKNAVYKAVNIAKAGDILVFTGKGHEKSLCRGKIEYPWDENKTILEAIKEKYK